MNPQFTYSIFKKIESDNPCFIYQGDFNDSITSTLLRLSESSIHNNLGKKNKRVAYLMGECFQNIIRHADKPTIQHQTNQRPQTFIARQIEDSFYISSVNLVENTKVETLKQKLKKLNTLNKADLKEAYMKALTSEEFTEKGGAGLGLIDMVRKSDHRLEFDFEGVNYFLSLFYFQIQFKKIEETDQIPNQDLPLKYLKELHLVAKEHNIIMVHKGDYSQEVILPLIEIIENNIETHQSKESTKKKTFYLLVELLQNLCKHSLSVDGIRHGMFMISKLKDKYIISIGNFVANDELTVFEKRIRFITGLSNEDLKDVYKESLLNEKTGYKGGAGLGLIDICRYSTEKVEYNFKPVDDTKSFFSMSVTI